MVQRRIFVSATGGPAAGDPFETFHADLLRRIGEAGYALEQFGVSGAALALEWSHENLLHILRGCVGAVVLGYGWQGAVRPSGIGYRRLQAERHYEGALAASLALPLLVFKGDDVADGGVLNARCGSVALDMPRGAHAPDVTGPVTQWLHSVAARHDVFLGYCSKSRELAQRLRRRLEHHGAHVLDWEMDFRFGQSILTEIESARRSCTGGVFLFTEDDKYDDVEGSAGPRDNVVFEAGYFISAKGADRCLIVRVGKAKMPADLGGGIYLPLEQASSIASVEDRLSRFVNEQL